MANRTPKLIEIPLGINEPQDFQLLELEPAFAGTVDASGSSVALLIERLDGAVIATPPTAAWLDDAAGTVRVSGVETLTVGNYDVRIKVTDIGGVETLFPSRKDKWIWNVFDIPAAP